MVLRVRITELRVRISAAVLRRAQADPLVRVRGRVRECGRCQQRTHGHPRMLLNLRVRIIEVRVRVMVLRVRVMVLTVQTMPAADPRAPEDAA
jgi:hypothetical protein